MGRDGRTSLRAIFTVARNPELTAEEVRTWMLYRSYEQSDGRGAYPGDELLAKHLDKSFRAVQGYRARLLELGYLRQQLRGPNPALYWAVVPDEGTQPTAKQDHEASPEADCEASQRSQNTLQKGSQNASQPTAPEYGEYGEYGEEDAEGSSLRSSPSGEAGGEQSGTNNRGSGTSLSREEILAKGPQAVGARFGHLLREHLYAPDGRPPKSYSEGRDVEILHELLRVGYRPERLELALLGVAHERDAGRLDIARPGQAVTARILCSALAGLRDPVVHFEDVGRRLQAGELDPDQSRSSSEEGLVSIGKLLNPARTNGDRPAAEKDA